MKKNYFMYLCIILIALFFSVFIVQAETLDFYEKSFRYEESEQYADVENKSAVIVCEYVDQHNKVNTGIYYKFKELNNPNARYSFGIWNVLYRESSSKSLKNIGANNTLSTGTFYDVFDAGGRISVSKRGTKLSGEAEEWFECFNYSLHDTSWNHEICFDDDTDCGSRFNDGKFKLKQSGSIYHIIYDYATERVYKEITFAEYLNDNLGLVKLIENKVNIYVTNLYSFGTKYEMPEFIKSYITDPWFILEENDANKNFFERMISEAKKRYENGQISETEKLKFEEKIKRDYDEYITLDMSDEKNQDDSPSYDGSFDSNRVDDFTTNCKDFAKTIRMGGYLVFIVKIALPLIMIVKASLSIISVVTSGKSEELLKQAKKFMTSAVAAILIFFIPTIVNVIFSFVAGFNDNMTSDSKICSACIFEPFSSTCTDAIDQEVK